MPLWRATAVFVALAAADILLAATGRDRRRWLTKPLLMPVLMAGRDRPAQQALALGGAGDTGLRAFRRTRQKRHRYGQQLYERHQ